MGDYINEIYLSKRNSTITNLPIYKPFRYYQLLKL